MLVPPDPKTTWKDEVSPTSPSRHRILSPKSNLRLGDSVNTLHHEEEAEVLSLIDEHADDRSSSTPLPPVPSTDIEHVNTLAWRRSIPHPLQPIITAPSANKSHGGQELDDGTALRMVWDPVIEAKTPTPTTAQFREMLSTYIGQEGEIDRLVDMAERVSDHRVSAARMEERHNLLASPLLSGEQRSTLLASYPETHHSAFLSARSTNLPPATFSVSPFRILSAFPTPFPITTTLQEIRLRALNLRVNQRLLPARTLLSHCAGGDELPALEGARAAASYAYLALSYSRSAFYSVSSEDGGYASAEDEVQAMALQGRCAYYVAIAEWVLAIRAGRRPSSLVSDDISGCEETEESVPLMSYFELACHAKMGGYVEGSWAAEWVEHLKRQPQMANKDGDRTWLEWLTSTWNPFSVRRLSFRMREGSMRTSNVRHEDIMDDNSLQGGSPVRNPNYRRTKAHRRLSFLSDHSISSDRATRQTQSPTDAGILSHSPPGDRQANIELFEGFEPTLPVPVTSPRGHPRTTSLTFQVPESLQSKSPTGESIYERGPDGRRHSLLARVTGWERQKSELEEAEEGDSPFQDSLEDGGGSPKGTKRWVLKKRKANEEEPEAFV